MSWACVRRVGVHATPFLLIGSTVPVGLFIYSVKSEAGITADPQLSGAQLFRIM